ncbi:MAG: hypothetical protein DHS20C01_09600 [marine bacterium B5-7]|nr:MAG: hypothetical protein DHS20C01_09600 [marine bacterium B5-7]
MSLLIVGLGIFFAVHLVPFSPALRGSLVSRFSENGYKLAFTAISLAGFVLIVMGMSRAPFIAIWQPPQEAQHVTRLLVLIGFILLPAAHMKTNIKRFTRHPMSWGVVFWGIGHLLANGDVASILLFGSFVLYSLASMVSANLRGAKKSDVRYRFSNDLIVIAAGAIAYLLLTWLHGYLFGYALI